MFIGVGGPEGFASNLSPGQWYQIPNSNISVIDPNPFPGGTGPYGKIQAWCSLAVDPDTSTIYQCAGGGHTDYAGNEVDRLRLNASAPVWESVRPPTIPVQNGNYYSDGRPSSRHHYYGLTFDTITRRIMLTSGSRYVDGQWTSRLDAFDLNTGDYVLNGLSSWPSAVSQEITAICDDPRNGNIYVFGNYNVAKWTRATGLWSTPISNSSFPFMWGNPSAFDSQRQRIVLIDGSSVRLWNCNTDSYTSAALSGTAMSEVEGAGMVYVPALDAFLLRNNGSGGGPVYQISAETFAVSLFSTSNGDSIESAGTPVYRKFLYVPNLRGCFYMTAHSTNCWFLRVH